MLTGRRVAIMKISARTRIEMSSGDILNRHPDGAARSSEGSLPMAAIADTTGNPAVPQSGQPQHRAAGRPPLRGYDRRVKSAG
jgi:hypothetical protein